MGALAERRGHAARGRLALSRAPPPPGPGGVLPGARRGPHGPPGAGIFNELNTWTSVVRFAPLAALNWVVGWPGRVGGRGLSPSTEVEPCVRPSLSRDVVAGGGHGTRPGAREPAVSARADRRAAGPTHRPAVSAVLGSGHPLGWPHAQSTEHRRARSDPPRSHGGLDRASARGGSWRTRSTLRAIPADASP